MLRSIAWWFPADQAGSEDPLIIEIEAGQLSFGRADGHKALLQGNHYQVSETCQVRHRTRVVRFE